MPLARRDCLTCIVRGPDCFCHLPLEALKDLQAIGRSIRLPKGAQLLGEGDGPTQVYLVCAGHIKLYATSSEGRVLLLRVGAPGDVLGLASALRGTRQKLTAEALDDCELKSVARDEFLRFAERHPSVNHNAAESSAKDFEGALISAQRLALSGSAAAKLASLLIEFAHLNGDAKDALAPVVFDMPLTHEEMGSMCGLSRETVTRLLSRFQREGLVQQANGQLLLHKPAALEKLFA